MKKMKENKGITLIALTITIIVLLIIAGISVYTGSKLIKEAKLEDVKTNMLLVQAEVKNYIEQAKFEKKSINDFLTEEGIKIDNVTFNVEAVNVNGQTYYKIKTPMTELNLSKLNKEDYLLVIQNDSQKPDEVDLNVDIYFKPGISNGEGNVYHLLSEMQ